MDGLFCVGMGIDQEAAIFISQELNGQPKFPCSISFYRIDDYVEAVCEHQGYTFMEFVGIQMEILSPVEVKLKKMNGGLSLLDR